MLCPNKQIEMPLRNIRSVEVGSFNHYPALFFVDYIDANSGIEAVRRGDDCIG